MAKKSTYHFNPSTLSYEKVVVSLRDRLKKVSTTVLLGIVLGVLFMIIGFQVIDSPKERFLKREIKQYRRQVRHLNDRMDRAEEVLKNLEDRDDYVYRTIFSANPIHKSVRYSGLGDDERYQDMKGYNCSAELISSTQKVDDLTKRLYVQSCSIDQIYKMALSKQDRMDAMPAIMPITKTQCEVVSGFGVRYHPILHYRRMHTGIDFAAQEGTPIYATGNGTVELSGRDAEGFSGYGVVVVINHGYGFKTLYGHMSSVAVSAGKKVKRGELIGYVGNTGLSKGAHLHYEVLQNGERVNPIYYFYNDLTPSEYEQVIEAANQENQCLS
ncbi:MAG: M23 family metallopeptidase [Bacteroidales bacterium]|nr:M23 family metallopeptidase [Candidatus Colimorpha onthohippi]